MRDDPMCKLCGKHGAMAGIQWGCNTAMSHCRYSKHHHKASKSRQKPRKGNSWACNPLWQAGSTVLHLAQAGLKVDLKRRLHFPYVITYAQHTQWAFFTKIHFFMLSSVWDNKRAVLGHEDTESQSLAKLNDGNIYIKSLYFERTGRFLWALQV